MTGDAVHLVLSAGDTAAYDDTVAALVADRFASRLAVRDATLWGPDAEEESARRLGWVDLFEDSRALLSRISSLRDDLADRGVTRVVLCGMGGSSLAPEVICATAEAPLVVLDSSHPDAVRAVLEDRLAETVVVVSSKSGGTVETDSQKRAFEHAFGEAGIDPAERIVVVTDPDSPLDRTAQAAGYQVFHADPEVGGRYSALTAFGLVPSGLAGVDLSTLIDDAEALAPALAVDDANNPALRLGALLGAANLTGVDKLVLANAEGPPGLPDWIEQLVAESTGKQGLGILPVVVEGPDVPGFAPGTPDSVLVALGPGATVGGPDAASGYAVALDAPLGALMLLWEHATAVAGRVLGINPFDQPDVESAKAAARELLDGDPGSEQPAFTQGDVQVFASPGDWLPDTAATVADAVAAALASVVPERGYLAVQAYLDRHRDAVLAEVRSALEARLGRPVTFGWGPRFLHSTGQYHKGGPPTGVFLQITSEPVEDLSVPGRPFTFGEFVIAQAVGDGRVLARHGLRVLRLHLTAPGALPDVRDALS